MNAYKWSTYLPSLFSLFLVIYICSSWGEKVPQNPAEYFSTGGHFSMKYLFIASLGYSLVFYIPIFKAGYHLRIILPAAERNKSTSVLGVFIAIVMNTLAARLASITGSLLLIYTSIATLTLFTIVFFIITQLYPEFYLDIDQTSRRHKTRQSTLAGVDTREKHLQLVELMLKERPYLNESLTLAELSSMINLTPHQLSELLNQKLEVSFANFVNRFRIEKAMQMMKEEKVDITSLSARVGFNTKSNFNVAFKNVTGQSPRQFMKKYHD